MSRSTAARHPRPSVADVPDALAAGTGSVIVVVDQFVVLINGPAGIGKTSVGLRVAARAANGACIPCDTRSVSSSPAPSRSP
jgi:hypothetical protein